MYEVNPVTTAGFVVIFVKIAHPVTDVLWQISYAIPDAGVTLSVAAAQASATDVALGALAVDTPANVGATISLIVADICEEAVEILPI